MNNNVCCQAWWHDTQDSYSKKKELSLTHCPLMFAQLLWQGHLHVYAHSVQFCWGTEFLCPFLLPTPDVEESCSGGFCYLGATVAISGYGCLWCVAGHWNISSALANNTGLHHGPLWNSGFQASSVACSADTTLCKLSLMYIILLTCSPRKQKS